MVLRLGLYFGGLAVDYVTGQADSVNRVQYRAAQLRCANCFITGTGRIDTKAAHTARSSSDRPTCAMMAASSARFRVAPHADGEASPDTCL